MSKTKYIDVAMSFFDKENIFNLEFNKLNNEGKLKLLEEIRSKYLVKLNETYHNPKYPKLSTWIETMNTKWAQCYTTV